MHILIAVIIGLIIVNFVIQRTAVEGMSMEPTLKNGDNLWVEKISTRLHKFNVGDIVTINANQPEFISPEHEPIIKRIIALENDKVEIKNGKVFINGKQLDEKYINGNYTNTGNNPQNSNLTVPKGHIYVLGDNRSNSTDSRIIGSVDIKKVTGRAVFRFYPLNKIGFLSRK